MQSTLAKLSLCRTAALGGRTLHCESCDHRCVVYNSCGDRHCPQCRGAQRANWTEATGQLLLPGVDYFQIVFTLPSQLSALALGNRSTVYNLLFTAAWQALREVIQVECVFAPAALMVLHTWNQRLEHHPHVHALVPGGGPSLADDRWIKSRHPKHRRRRKPYLVDNRLLSRRFRDLFLAGIKKLHTQGKLRIEGDDALRSLSADLASQDWVVYIEPPPCQDAAPQHVLKYLARYLTGGPISARRLIAHTAGHVTFAARSQNKSGSGPRPPRIPVTLTGVEFVRRWSLHILPKGFTKVRRYGGYSNRHCQTYLNRCRELLHTTLPDDEDPPASQADDPCDTEAPTARCPNCRSVMRCLTEVDRPSWYEVMTGRHRPFWYRDG